MKEFKIEKIVQGYKIIASGLFLEKGINVSLVGGISPHIGAISIISPNGNISTTLFEGHKDHIISEKWTNVLINNDIKPAVISVGIHYDFITKDGINNILSITNQILEELLVLKEDDKNV